MSLTWPALIFASAFILALALLYFCRAKAWYLHLLSLAAAIALMLIPRGSMPLPPAGTSKSLDLAEMFVIVFLFLWGLGGPFFRGARSRRAR
jgi:hypothetical protein